MSGQAPLDIPPPPPPPPVAARQCPPTWGIALFLLLLGGLVLLNQVATTGGPPIQWIENDLDAALRQAAAKNQRVFLYLYEPNDPTHQRNEREVFTQRWARQPLEKAVCCRLAVKPGDMRPVQYRYEDQPLFLLLSAKGREMGRTRGAVTELEFLTSIGRPAEDYVTHKQAATAPS